MRLPNRKPGKYTFKTYDHVMTQEKLDELKSQLDRLLTRVRPKAIQDTKRFAENGDFSENAEYQIAKSRLRGINQKIDELEYQIARAQIIQPPTDTACVALGHTVVIEMNGNTHTFTILGSEETRPDKGIVSYTSPLGAALIGKSTGDSFTLPTGARVYIRAIIVD